MSFSFMFVFSRAAPAAAAVIVKAAALPPADFDGTAFDPERFSVEQGVGRLAPGGVANPAERRSGYGHPLGGFLLIKAFEIRQAEGFKLVQGHDDLFQRGAGDPDGLEDCGHRSAGDMTTTVRSGHVLFRTSIL